MKKIIIFLLIVLVFLFGCSLEPKYTAEEWEKIQTTEIITTTKLSEEAKFDSDLKEFMDFIIYYKNSKQEFENIWPKSLQDKFNGNFTVEELIGYTTKEINAINDILDYPEYVSKYIEYDLLYIKARGDFYSTIALLSDNGKKDISANNMSEYSDYLDKMFEYTEERDNELRNILIDFNNRAKELGIKIPFPNP